MDVILNDLSLCGQYESVHAFADYLCDNVIPIMNIMERINAIIYKSQNTYNRHVTDSLKLMNVMQSSNVTEITVLKSKLSTLSWENPYWEDSSEYADNANYEYSELSGSNKSDEEPNAYTEAIDRSIDLLCFTIDGNESEPVQTFMVVLEI